MEILNFFILPIDFSFLAKLFIIIHLFDVLNCLYIMHIFVRTYYFKENRTVFLSIFDNIIMVIFY